MSEPFVIAVDASPIGGWPSDEVDHVGMQLSVLENRPLVGSDGLLKSIEVEDARWFARIHASRRWSDASTVDAEQVAQRIVEVAQSPLGWPLQPPVLQSELTAFARSSQELVIDG